MHDQVRTAARRVGQSGAVVLVLGSALLAGCSQPQQASTSLPTAIQSATPTTEVLPPLGPAEFPVPAEARTRDAAGAEAFLRYWIDLLNRQQAIPAGQPLRDLGPECVECARIARVYDEAATAGHSYAGGALTLNDVPPPVMEGDQAMISFGAREEAVQLVDGSGAVIEGLETAPNLSSGITLTWSETPQGWSVASMTLG